jgi:5-methylcytosine-specific restriction endonuclease McrBC GTP-binding regulatory subunit McrB
MSDILSAIETRRYESGRIVTDPVIPSSNYGNDSSAAGRYGKVILPGNLYIVGTVNMDETTFPFSKKVLDRANTIEFSYVDLLSMPTFSTQSAEQISVQNDFLVSKYITLNDCDAKDAEYISSVCTTLQRINSVLEKANAHVGYRVRDEIVFYMLNNRESGLLDETVALDNQIMQKILPRIQGSSEAIKAMLEDLLKVCASEKYTASEKKINFMIKRYEEDGFTSYWL